MEDLLKQRQTRRLALSQYCDKISANIDANPLISVVALERHIAEINARISKVTETHNNLTEIVDEEGLANLISEQDDWLEPRLAILDKVSENLLQKRTEMNSTTVQESSMTDSVSRGGDNSDSLPLVSGIKLGRLDLAIFDGVDLDSFADYKEDHYTNVYCNKTISPSMKMSYLKRTCKGDAHKMISGYSLTEKSYKIAWELLNKRYGRPERTAMRHISALLNLEQPKHERGPAYVRTLYSLLNDVNLHVRSLENLIDTLKAEDILVPLIISKFPNPFLHEFGKSFRDKNYDLKKVLEFLESECQRYEFVSDISQNMSDVSHSKGKTSAGSSHKGSAVALQVNSSEEPVLPETVSDKSNNTCAYCKGNHASRQCSKFWKANVGARREMVLQSGLCFKCLRGGGGIYQRIAISPAKFVGEDMLIHYVTQIHP